MRSGERTCSPLSKNSTFYEKNSVYHLRIFSTCGQLVWFGPRRRGWCNRFALAIIIVFITTSRYPDLGARFDDNLCDEHNDHREHHGGYHGEHVYVQRFIDIRH